MRPNSEKQSARLYSLMASRENSLDQGITKGNIVMIYFPAMPEMIDLDRAASYEVTSPITAPDGQHVFKSVTPLSVPITFKLHAFDDYCPEGPIDLLRIGARLHALMLALRSGASADRIVQANSSEVKKASDKQNENPDKKSDSSTVAFNNRALTDLKNTGVKSLPSFPPVCVLDLIWTGPDSPGIKLGGYVQAVRVKFKGPWLKVDGPGNYKNLPSAAEYSFTFVSAPGYRNGAATSGGAFEAQMFGEEVRNVLYNATNAFSRGKGGDVVVGFPPGS